MKLAEALAVRADAQKRLEQLRSRAADSARYQEGEPPAENAAQLLQAAREAIDEIEDLVRRINRTNSTTEVEAGVSITDAIARRDALRTSRSVVVAVADAASGHQHDWGRQLRSELRFVTEVPVAELRGEADRLARDFRELDTKIQAANWATELLD